MTDPTTARTTDPTGIHALSASSARITAAAQSAVMNLDAPLGLWRLAAGLDAAFRAGRDLHVTLVPDQDLYVSVMKEEDKRTQVFTPLNAEYLLITSSTNLIMTPDLQAEVTIREHIYTGDGILTETRLAHVHTGGPDLRDMHHPDLPGGRLPLKPNERAVPLSELLPDCDHASAALATLAKDPLDLLRRLYPNHPYPRALTGAPAPVLPSGSPDQRGVCAALPDELRTSALGDLTERIDAAFSSGRHLNLYLTINQQTLTVIRRDDGSIFSALYDNEDPTPRILITVTERQQDTLTLGETVNHLRRICESRVVNGQLMDTPYTRWAFDRPLHRLHMVTPVDTLLPPLRA